MDDFALFHDDPGQIEDWRRRVARFLEGRRLRLHSRKTRIARTEEPAEFLGFVLLPGGRRRLPEENVRRFRNRLRGLRDRWRGGRVTHEENDEDGVCGFRRDHFTFVFRHKASWTRDHDAAVLAVPARPALTTSASHRDTMRVAQPAPGP